MSENTSSNADALMDEGMALMQEGRIAEAEAKFQAAAETHALPAARANWALCRHLSGDHDGALAVMGPLLRDPAPQPFVRTLACLAEGARGDLQAARAMLAAAVQDYDRGVADPLLRDTDSEEVWLESGITLKQTAGALGDHAQVIALHERWPGKELPRSTFSAGVAAFNLQRYTEAARYWRSMTDPGWTNLMAAYADVAERMEPAQIPFFPLEYDPSTGWSKKKNPSSDELRKMVDQGSLKVRCLALMFGGTPEDQVEMTALLVLYGEGWGLELGRAMIANPSLPEPVRAAAARSLKDNEAMP